MGAQFTNKKTNDSFCLNEADYKFVKTALNKLESPYDLSEDELDGVDCTNISCLLLDGVDENKIFMEKKITDSSVTPVIIENNTKLPANTYPLSMGLIHTIYSLTDFLNRCDSGIMIEF